MSDVELTAERRQQLEENFDRYRLMAERRLIQTPENLEAAHRIRKAMTRKPGDPWTLDQLALFAQEWSALVDAPHGRIRTLMVRWGVTERSSIYRMRDRAIEAGFLESD